MSIPTKLVVGFVALAAMMGIPAEAAITPSPNPPTNPVASPVANPCPKLYKLRQYRRYVSVVYLERDHITRSARKRLNHMELCQHSNRSRKKARRLRKRLQEQRRLMNAITPFPGPNGTHWAIPWYIVACESGGNFRARNQVSTAGGAYQVIDSTWTGNGGTAYRDSHPAAVAPPIEQHQVAHRVWINGGAGQWECS